MAKEGEKPEMRMRGLDVVGDVPWGTHLCQFYQTKEDLVDVLVPYFKAGLEGNEFCMWVTSEPLTVQDAKTSLQKVVKDLDSYIKKGQIEILDASQWYTKSGKFEAAEVLQGWVRKENQALKRGFDGLRLTGNTFWLEAKDWREFAEYEAVVNNVIGEYRMIALCSYSLDKCGASEVIDVVSNHQFALIRRGGKWELIEGSERKQAEEALRETRDYLESLINYANAPIIVWNPEFRITRFNHAFEHLTGHTADEVIGQELHMLFPEASREESLSKIARTLSGEYWESVGIPILCKDGDTRVALWNSANIYAEDGTTLLATIAQGVDITERKRGEAEIRRRSEELAALNTIATTVTSTIDLQEVLQTIQQRVMELLGEKYPPIFSLFNERDQTFQVVLTYVQEEPLRRVEELLGVKLEELVLSLLRMNQALREALLAGKLYVTDDGSDLLGPGVGRSLVKRAQRAMGVKWIMGLPLWVKTRLVGIMVLFSQEEHVPDEEIELLSSIASQAAIAIEHARLYEQTDEKLRHRVAELTALNTITGSLTSTLELDEILESIVTRVAQVMRARICTIRLVQGNELTIGAAVGYGDESSSQHTIKIDQRLACIVRDQRPLLIEDLWQAQDIPPSRRMRALREGVHSFLGVPIVSKGETIGILSIYGEKPYRFTEGEISLLLTIANQAALAIENARLYESVVESAEAAQHRAERLQSLQEASASLVSSLSLEEVLRRIAHEALRSLKTEGAYLLMANVKEERLEGRIFVSTVDGTTLSTIERLWGSKLDDLKIPFSRKENWLVQVLDSGEARLGVDLSEMAGDPVAEYWREPLKELMGTASISIVPLRSRDKILGLMILTTSPYKEMSEEDQRLIETYANQAVLAIENAKLYERVREHAEELERLVEERTKELRAIHAELLQSAKLAAIGQLAAGVAHELNNPLGAVSGYLELLQEEVELGPREMEYMERIEKRIQQATKIVRELRGTWIPSKSVWQVVNVNDFLEETLTLVERRLSLQQIRVQKDLSPDLPHIHADPDRLEQVFINLITNAKKAMAEGGTLRVTSRESRNGEWVETIFADTGEGIAKEHWNKIFDPFFTTRSPGEGMGLGLSVSHRHIRDHGGTIDFWSEKGRGTVFRVVLPPLGGKRCWEIRDCGEKERCKAVQENAHYRCWSVMEDAWQCENCVVYRRRALPPLDETLLPQ